MRTLNKALCLVLAVVMVVGMCAFSVSAEDNLAEFTDGKDISSTYKEAIDLLVGVKVVEGMGDGTINLTGKYTRAQAATIVARIKLGTTGANNLKCVTAPFTDVGVDHWAAGAIAYCAQAGILDGLGDGSFDPEGTLTGYAFGKMLLCAVGYGQNGEYVGTGWEINVAKDGVKRKVYDTNDLGAATNDVITRQQAMLMAFNTLTKVNVVKFSTLINDYVNVNASQQQIVTSGSVDKDYLLTDNFTNIRLAIGPVVWNNTYNSYVVESDYAYIVDDEYDKEYVDDARAWYIPVEASYTDVGRIFSVWYDYKTSGNTAKAVTTHYAKDTLLYESHDNNAYYDLTLDTSSKFKVAVTDINSASKATVNGAWTVECYVNGAKSTLARVVELCGTPGVSVSFYDWDKNNRADVITVIEPRVAKLNSAPSVSADGKNVTISSSTTEISKQWDAKKVEGYEGLAKNDYVLYVIDNAQVLHIVKPETITGSVRRTNGKTGNSAAVLYIGDESYKVSGLTGVSTGLANDIINQDGKECRFYKDSFGYIVAYDKLSSSSTDYVVLLDLYYSVPTVSVASQDVDLYAKVLNPDATTRDIKLVKLSQGMQVDNTDNKYGEYRNMKVKMDPADNTYKIFYDYYYKSGNTTIDQKNLSAGVLSTTWSDMFYQFYRLSPSGSGYELEYNLNQDYYIFDPADAEDLALGNGFVTNSVPAIGYDTVLTSRRYANNNTVYLYHTGSAYRAVTGVNNAPTSKFADTTNALCISVMGSNMDTANNSTVLQRQQANYVFISSANLSNSGNKYFVFNTTPAAKIADDASTTDVNESGYSYKVLKDGKMEELIFQNDTMITEKGWYELTFGGSNDKPASYVTEADYSITGQGVNSDMCYGIASSDNGIVTLGVLPTTFVPYASKDTSFKVTIDNATYSYGSDVKVYVINTDDTLTVGGSELLATDINDLVFTVADSESKNTKAKEIYVIKVAEPSIKNIQAEAGQNLLVTLAFDSNDMSWLTYDDAGLTGMAPKYEITLTVSYGTTTYTSKGVSLLNLLSSGKYVEADEEFVMTITLDAATKAKLADASNNFGSYETTVQLGRNYYVSLEFKDVTTGATWTMSKNTNATATLEG